MSHININENIEKATVQLVFLMKTRIIGDSEATKQYQFIYIILFAFILNVYCVVKAIYEKDLLLTSEQYRKHKTIQQISTHVIFRFVDISLRIIILSMLWLTIGFGGVFVIVLCEFLILSYLAYYTKQYVHCISVPFHVIINHIQTTYLLLSERIDCKKWWQ